MQIMLKATACDFPREKALIKKEVLGAQVLEDFSLLGPPAPTRLKVWHTLYLPRSPPRVKFGLTSIWTHLGHQHNPDPISLLAFPLTHFPCCRQNTQRSRTRLESSKNIHPSCLSACVFHMPAGRNHVKPL